MKACILAIGSEMLTPFRVDTNSLLITERLNAIGYDVRLKAVVADEVDELAEIIRAAMAWADLIMVTGGLGPTEDDITRDAVARALDTPLDVDEAIADRIRDRFARRGMTMPEINRRSDPSKCWPTTSTTSAITTQRGRTLLTRPVRHAPRVTATRSSCPCRRSSSGSTPAPGTFSGRPCPRS